MRPIDIPVGARFGRLQVVALASSAAANGERMYDCACDCGILVSVRSASLRRGRQRSCGCLKRELDLAKAKHAADTRADRFWARVQRGAPHECWLWLGHIDAKGYGKVRVAGPQKIASRVAWELANGPMPSHLFACHHCDNPSCVNPGHIYAGTRLDNARDAVKRGRTWSARGRRPPSRRMTDAQVLYIRTRSKSLRALADELGFTYAHVGKVRRGEVNA